jgi:hypothetical protein
MILSSASFQDATTLSHSLVLLPLLLLLLWFLLLLVGCMLLIRHAGTSTT